MLSQPIIVIGLFSLLVLIAFLAGSYPAFYLTSFKPVEVLEGKIRAGMKSSGIRNSLVVFQFVISIALIIASLMVYNQLNFLQSKNLGFDKENIINLFHTGNLKQNGEAFKHELLKYPDVVGASYSNRLPPNIDWTSTFQTEAGDQSFLFAIYMMDYDHLKTLGYEMVKGRFFSKEHPIATTSIIVNETAARQLGIYDDFQGKKLKTFFNSENGITGGDDRRDRHEGAWGEGLQQEQTHKDSKDQADRQPGAPAQSSRRQEFLQERSLKCIGASAEIVSRAP